jgi:hypothetical protein
MPMHKGKVLSIFSTSIVLARQPFLLFYSSTAAMATAAAYGLAPLKLSITYILHLHKRGRRIYALIFILHQKGEKLLYIFYILF